MANKHKHKHKQVESILQPYENMEANDSPGSYPQYLQ